MLLYCLDNSDAACRSEDYPCGNRLAWQLAVVRTVSRSLLTPQQGQHLGNINNAVLQLAVVSSAGRPLLSVAPTSDATALLGLDVSCLDGERCQLLGALRLALLAVKRSSTGRVLAFLASETDLPSEQCRQLSRSFADARVPLDVVVLCPNDELSSELMASLQLLTAVSVYEQPASNSAVGSSSQRPGLKRGTPGSEARAALGGQTVVRQPGLSTAVSGAVSSPAPGMGQVLTATGAETRLRAAGADGSTNVGLMPGGQRLLLFTPPDPSLALWQQMEPLLELLQLDVQLGSRQSGSDGEPSPAGAEDERGVPSQLRIGSGAGRPPLPRPPRFRAGSATSASASIGQRAPGLAPPGPLTSRSGARGAAVGTCRYESLDSLQHLSLDGFLRSWLPSYANFSRVLQLPQAAAAVQQQQQGSGAGDGTSAGTSLGNRSTDTEGSAGGLGPGRLCYISVYRLQLPRWHKLCDVNAGRMYEIALPQGAEPPGTENGAPEGGVFAATASAAAASTQTGAHTVAELQQSTPPPPARAAVVVPRAPCPVQVHFSTRCSSAAATAAATDGDSPEAAQCQWVYPDLRRGSLSLVASVEDEGAVKLLWSERQRPVAQQQPQYGSIFATPEESSDNVEPSAAELELTLSATRSQFRVVPHVKGGAVLEILYPRNGIHRLRPSGSNTTTGSVPPHHVVGALGIAPQRGSHGGGASIAAAQPSAHQSQQQQQHDRYFFWLQQDWQPEGAGSVAAAGTPTGQTAAPEATPETSGWAGEAGSSDRGVPVRSGPLPDRGCRALVEHLQALLECPPEFDPQKHSCRVRCSSTPLQLGPLPFALVEEIMRASGRQLHPDGTLAVATTAKSAFSAAAAAAVAASSNHSAITSAVASTARLPAAQQQLQQQQSGSAGAETLGTGGELCRGPSTAAAAPRDESGTNRVQRADGLRGLVAVGSRSPAGPSGSGVAASAVTKRSIAAANTPPATSATAATAGGTSGPRASGGKRSSQSSELRATVPGFSRTTYSRAHAPGCGANGCTMLAGQGPQNLGRLEAAKALSSHPLDDKDWGSDCDSRAEGISSAGSSGAATPRFPCCSSSGKDPLAPGPGEVSGAGSDDADSISSVLRSSSTAAIAAASAATTTELPPAPPPCLPSACTRGGLAAAAAVAAAAAAVSSSGPSLVAAVEPEAGGSCTEDSSLMFELD